jgi:putative hydrolase of the HAD superfamily
LTNSKRTATVEDSVICADRDNAEGIKAIIFDLGNVLIDFDHRIAARKISKFTDKTGEEIYALFFDSGLTGLFEEGKIAPRKFFSQVKEMLNLRLDYDEFVPIWDEIFFLSEKNIEVYHLACRLRGRYKTALLSNINILHLEYIKKKFTVFDPFQHIVTSCEVGVRKPHPLIYQKTLKALGVPAGSVFYTDDRTELIEGARALGIKGFTFNGVKQLEADFLRAGVAIN